MMDFEEYKETVNRGNPFMRHNRIRVLEVDETHALVQAEPNENALNTMGTVHGGLIITLAEIAAGTLVRSDGRAYVTTDTGFHFLSTGKASEPVLARASAIRRGRKLCFIRSEVYQGERLLAAGDFIYCCLTE